MDLIYEVAKERDDWKEYWEKNLGEHYKILCDPNLNVDKWKSNVGKLLTLLMHFDQMGWNVDVKGILTKQ